MASSASSMTLASKRADAGSTVLPSQPWNAKGEAEAVGKHSSPLPAPAWVLTCLLLHLLNLLHRAAALGPVLMPKQVHAELSSLIELLLLLLLSLLQLALRTDALRVVHVVGFHDLGTHEWESRQPGRAQSG